jgi:hypothetical protein
MDMVVFPGVVAIHEAAKMLQAVQQFLDERLTPGM